MATEANSFATIKLFRGAAATLRGATARWAEKYADRKHYDKQGFGFTRHERTGGFKLPALNFEAYVGTYGCSSVGTAWSVPQEVIDRFIVEALNLHKQTIFDTIADLAEAEASTLVEKARADLAAMSAMLDDAEKAAGDTNASLAA